MHTAPGPDVFTPWNPSHVGTFEKMCRVSALVLSCHHHHQKNMLFDPIQCCYMYVFVFFPTCMAIYVYAKDSYQVYKTLKKLCEFSTLWVDWADLGSQKSFSKLQQFSHVRHMTIFKLIFKNLPKSEKVGLPCFQTKKGMIEKTHGFESLNIFS